MKRLAEQPYVKMEREIGLTGQHYVEENRRLYLYADRIVSRHHVFPIEKVWDMSYRPVSDDGGLLYLHTSEGVHVYTLKESPEHFIEVFRQAIKKQR
ncbi:hypothetical protein [Lentibacillus salinarum]|uniref:GRAM domain-containing protein n=1 Tax=Lentibacillus salinarum TaxID=446820 RepID=A0ABW3ZXY1_9BACI